MKSRLIAHCTNLSTALAVLDQLPKTREAAIVRTHLQESRHLLDETLDLLRGTHDHPNTKHLHEREISQPTAAAVFEFLVEEKAALKDTAESYIEAEQHQRADVLFAQSVFSALRINIALAARWLNDTIKSQ